ncbi:MAG: UTP--glucose-1-phosphate uridylyltransferase [Candidatus Margulisbacteria bacterium]|nr:UTP--glucose-1-phosphate uridylyltransferase [Candidatus Margulisiibacteriota bacterium]
MTSSIYLVGQKKPTGVKGRTAISFGKTPCHQVILTNGHGQQIVAVPTTYGYLLQGRDGTPWHQMPEAWQAQRFADLKKIPWDTTDTVRRMVANPRSTKIRPERVKFIDPATIPTLAALSKEGKHEQLGESLIRSGALARMTVAGGEAARFRNPGDPRPKGLIEITDEGPLAHETYISAMARDHFWTQLRLQPSAPMPWLLFVSEAMRPTFEAYFEQNGYFGLDPDSIILFENTAYVPKFRPDARIATLADMDGGSSQEDQMAFYTSGHGALARAYRENPVFIRGKKYDTTPYEVLRQRDVNYIFQSNIDNLGAKTSTRGYSIALGFYASEEAEHGYKMEVELTSPLIGLRPDGTKFFWDEGGVAMEVDGVRTIVDGHTMDPSLKQLTSDPEKPFPFNTANATYGRESIPSEVTLPDQLQQRNGLHQLDRNFWNMAGLIPTTFVRVPRNIPENCAELPPTKVGQPASRLAAPTEAGDEIDKDNRFMPVKQWGHRKQASRLYSFFTEPARDRLLGQIKTTSTILIVDDADVFRNSVAESLGKDGWKNIVTAASRAEAEKLLANTKFDVVLLDSVLDPGQQGTTGGAAILKALKENPGSFNYGAKVIFWTSQQSIEASQGLSVFQTSKYSDVEFTKKDLVDFNRLGERLAKLILGE